MSLPLAILVLLASPTIPAGNHQTALPKDLDALQGRWRVQWVERDGEKILPQRDGYYTIRGNKWLIGMEEIAVLTLDPGFEPKLLDFTSLFGNEKGAKVEGIYKIDGDTMVWCWYGSDGVKQRPLEFRAEKGSNRIVYGLIRANP